MEINIKTLPLTLFNNVNLDIFTIKKNTLKIFKNVV